MTADHKPAHAPFETGNSFAERHGADSERRVRPVAARLAAEAVEAAPWLSRPAFRAALTAWARAEARVELVDVWLQDRGLLDDDGEPRPAATYLMRLEAAAASRRAALGLDPQSFGKLLAAFEGTSTAGDVLSALQAEGRRILAARPAAALTGAERPEIGGGS